MKGLIAILLTVALATAQAQAGKTTGPNEPLQSPPPSLSQGGFYKKCAYFHGLPIIGSEKVDDRAFHVLIRSLGHMLAKVPDSEFQLLVDQGSHYSIIADEEGQTDLPEYRDMKNDPKVDWNKRARGLGGLVTSAAEENILEYPNDRYKGESIYIHEFGHTLANYVFAKADKSFRPDLRKAYKDAIAAGLWKNTYSATNSAEYWAEGVQMYFDCARSASPPNGVHNEICNREGLAKYDPELYALVDREFRSNPWRYDGTYNTTHKAH